MERFASNGDVAFGDVNLSENGVREVHGENQSPGSGGWPTIRYFNKDTGYGGAPYTKKTDKAMCDELGDEEYMQAYVEEMGKTNLCSVTDPHNCSDKEKDYIEKMKDVEASKIEKQITRLEGMEKKKMIPANKQWIKQRLSILRQFDRAKSEL